MQVMDQLIEDAQVIWLRSGIVQDIKWSYYNQFRKAKSYHHSNIAQSYTELNDVVTFCW